MKKKNQTQFTDISEDSIVVKEDYLATRGSILNEIVIAVVQRDVFIMVILVFLVAQIFLFYTGMSLLGIATFILFMILRSVSLNKIRNIYFIDKASPLIKKIWPKRWLDSKEAFFLWRFLYKTPRAIVGDMLVGYEVTTNRQLWKSSSDFLYHSYILGASGSGKSVFLMSVFVVNYLAMSSGVWFLDFKGTVLLIGEFLSTAFRFGRINCVRVTNFLNAQKRGSVQKNSNTTTMMLTNDPHATYTFLSPFFSTEGGGGDNRYFQDNAIKALQTILAVLHHLQEKRYLIITPKIIRQYAVLDNFLALYHDPRISDEIKKVFLVPTYEAFTLKYKKPNAKQLEDPVRMYGIYVNTFDSPLQMITNEFGQIFEANVNEFDVCNMVKQRQLGLSILPTSEKTQSETEALATALISQIRLAVGGGLGGALHGSRVKNMNVARTSDEIPFSILADEYWVGLVATGGIGTLMSQGRGAGLAGAAASQDVVALDEMNKKEHGQVYGSTMTKYILCMKDAIESLRYIDALIPSVEVYKKGVSKDWHSNKMDNTLTEIKEIKAYDALKLTDNDQFPQGTLLAFGPGHITKIKCFFYDQTEFMLENYRLVTQLPALLANEKMLIDGVKIVGELLKLKSNIENACKDLVSEIGIDKIGRDVFSSTQDSIPAYMKSLTEKGLEGNGTDQIVQPSKETTIKNELPKTEFLDSELSFEVCSDPCNYFANKLTPIESENNVETLQNTTDLWDLDEQDVVSTTKDLGEKHNDYEQVDTKEQPLDDLNDETTSKDLSANLEISNVKKAKDTKEVTLEKDLETSGSLSLKSKLDKIYSSHDKVTSRLISDKDIYTDDSLRSAVKGYKSIGDSLSINSKPFKLNLDNQYKFNANSLKIDEEDINVVLNDL